MCRTHRGQGAVQCKGDGGASKLLAPRSKCKGWLEDRPPAETPSPGEDAEALAVEVEALMRDVIRIANRLNGKPEKEVGDLRRGLFPTPFSFYVGNTFEGAPREQQALLELEDTAARLRRERDTLRNTLNYLTAASAVKDVFPSSPSSG
ncbi:unnamed protein product [Triticum turgidum subsp. durum]|uniref:Uncharacterized protein n=1 Tax=Triticum turgidum subsp. durum TaxID=4567 RepID=A0A9R1NR82_TRITD|nr:unnamed protein product [Triticum turgidum subsp. durum]